MKTQCPSFANPEKGSALIFVVLASFICLTVAVSLIATRNQAMKLAKRQQLDSLGHLDLAIQTANLNGQIASMVKQQNGTNVLDTGTAVSFVSTVGGVGGILTDPTNGDVSPYTVTIGQQPPRIQKTLSQYTPQSSNSFKLAPGTPLTTDPSDPLLGVQSGIPLGVLPIQIYATPTGGATVFYPNKTSTLQYTFRQVPLSIYSLYATGSTAVTPGLLAGDPGRIYAGQSLTVTGSVTASRPVIAQQGVTFGNATSQLGVSQSINANPALAAAGLAVPQAQTLTSNTGATDQAQMLSGNQILTTGMQEKDLQNVPTTNFSDFVSPTNPSSPVQLGGQCAFNISYVPQPANPAGVVTGAATVLVQSGGQVAGLALTALQNITDPNLIALKNGVALDSNTLNGSWDNPALNLAKPPGYTAAVTAGGTRLMNAAGTAPMQFIVLDYARVTALLAPAGSSVPQTFYVWGKDATAQAVLLRGGVMPGTTVGMITNGFSLVSNLDVYIYQGIAPTTSSVNPAISIITAGQVHAAY